MVYSGQRILNKKTTTWKQKFATKITQSRKHKALSHLTLKFYTRADLPMSLAFNLKHST